MVEYFQIECYFKNPKTGEPGWEIVFIDVKGKTRSECAEKIKKMAHFDCFIDILFDRFND